MSEYLLNFDIMILFYVIIIVSLFSCLLSSCFPLLTQIKAWYIDHMLDSALVLPAA
jgi:hypothetical protein